MWKDFSTDTYEHRYIGVLPRIKLPQRATSEKYHFNNHVQHDLLFVSRKSLWKKRWSLCSTSDMNFHSPRPIWLRVDINTKLQTWHHFPRKTSQPPGGRLIELDHFHHWGNSTCSHWGRGTFYLYGFAVYISFLWYFWQKPLSQYYIQHHMWQRNSYYIKYWIYAHGSHWTVLFPSCRNSWPSKIVKWPLENSIMVPAGESIFRAGIVALCMIGSKSM